jgi:uncharacterized membrane protein YgcG
MNLQGQLLADRLALAIVLFFSVWGFAVGYYLETFQWTLVVFACGMLTAAVAVLPDWPVFNQSRNELTWKDPAHNEARALLDASSSSSKSSSSSAGGFSSASNSSSSSSFSSTSSGSDKGGFRAGKKRSKRQR